MGLTVRAETRLAILRVVQQCRQRPPGRAKRRIGKETTAVHVPGFRRHKLGAKPKELAHDPILAGAVEQLGAVFEGGGPRGGGDLSGCDESVDLPAHHGQIGNARGAGGQGLGGEPLVATEALQFGAAVEGGLGSGVVAGLEMSLGLPDEGNTLFLQFDVGFAGGLPRLGDGLAGNRRHHNEHQRHEL